MKKRFLSFLLAGSLLFTAVSGEALAAAPQTAGEIQTVEETQTAEILQSREGKILPEGALSPKAIEISGEDEAAIGALPKADVQTDTAGVYGSQKYESDWDIYASNYIYNRLSAKEKTFWERINLVCRKYLTTTEDAVKLTVSGKNYYVTNYKVLYSDLGITKERTNDLFIMFSYSNPQYYFLGNGYLIGNGIIYPIIYDEFAMGTARKAETARFKAQIDTMKAKVEKGNSEVEKAKIAHDLIVEKIMYDPGFGFADSQPYTPFHQSAYSVFCDDYTVCAGYSKAFEILMNSVGIDTIGVTSTVHAWNAICLNDTWYYVDCTWDDPDGRNGYEKVYDYFGLSESTLTGSMDQKNAHQLETMYAGMAPKCTKDMGSTKDAIGTVYVPGQTAAAPKITQKKTTSGMSVTLSCATPGADIYYTIDGKEPDSSFTRSFHYTGSFKITSNVTVKAIAVCDGKWDSPVSSVAVNGKMCTVTFNTMGGKKIASRKVWPGTTVKKPADPTRAGYTFGGWYKGKKYQSKWNFSTKITKDTTIYAKWDKVKVKKTSITSLKNLSGKKLKVTFKKVSGAKGYQIRYSTSAKLKFPKKVAVKSTSKTITGLKKGKKYYVQVRAYKLDSAGKKVWGSWSSTKAVTISK